MTQSQEKYVKLLIDMWQDTKVYTTNGALCWQNLVFLERAMRLRYLVVFAIVLNVLMVAITVFGPCFTETDSTNS